MVSQGRLSAVIDEVQPLVDSRGPVAVIAPHMDDEVIGCGALLASLAARNEIVHLYFAGEGLGSFSPGFVAGRGFDDLIAVRRAEALKAAECLGIGAGLVTFGGFREWRFARDRDALRQGVHDWLDRVAPVIVLAPFRLDCHPDHTGLSALTRAWADRHPTVRVLEYFVYHHLRLIPGGDMRGLIRPDCLAAGPGGPFIARKEKALRAYVSQVTNYDPARPGPVLDDAFIAGMVKDPELYLDAGGQPLSRIMRRHRYAKLVSNWQFRLKWIRHRLKGGMRHFE